MNFIKYIFTILVLTFSLSSNAAPSDCLQLEADGTVNCIPATVVFNYGSQNFNTAEELTAYLVNLMCSAYVGAYECYAQYQNNPIYPPLGRPVCSSTPTCGRFIDYTPNQTQNRFNVVATVLNNTDSYYSDKHFQRSIVGFRLMSCPIGLTTIDVGGGTVPYHRWCKPNNIQFEPTSCTNGCNLSSGDASY